MSEDAKSTKAPEAKPLAMTVIVGLLVPGGAQFLQGRKQHALLLGGSGIALFLLGMVISNWTAIDRANHDVYFIMQALTPTLTFGSLFSGLAQEPLIGETVTAKVQTYGIAATAIAGIMNVLAILESLRHAPEIEIIDETPEEEQDEEAGSA